MNSWALQQAIYTALNGVIMQDGSAVAVYDKVPDNASKPYIVIGNETVIDHSTKSNNGYEHTFMIHVWSEYEGLKEVKEIMENVFTLLQNRDIVIPNASVIDVRNEFSQVMEEDDGITRHGVMRFRIVVFDKGD